MKIPEHLILEVQGNRTSFLAKVKWGKGEVFYLHNCHIEKSYIKIDGENPNFTISHYFDKYKECGQNIPIEYIFDTIEFLSLYPNYPNTKLPLVVYFIFLQLNKSGLEFTLSNDDMLISINRYNFYYIISDNIKIDGKFTDKEVQNNVWSLLRVKDNSDKNSEDIKKEHNPLDVSFLLDTFNNRNLFIIIGFIIILLIIVGLSGDLLK